MPVMALYNPRTAAVKHGETFARSHQLSMAFRARFAGLCRPSRQQMSSIQVNDLALMYPANQWAPMNIHSLHSHYSFKA